VTDLYSEVMDTGMAHVGVTVRDEARVALGRAGPDDPVAILNADIRGGRSFDQRETLAMRVMDEMSERWGVAREHCYVVFTEHPGEDFLLREGALEGWSEGEERPAGGE
jgi:hypothetical protein